jgi:hypothetical protein
MLQRDGVVMMVMKVLVMLTMMMIPMMPSSMTVTMTMAMISSLQEGISPANFCLPESFLSLCVFHPAEAVESFCDPPPDLRFPRG